MVADGLLYVFPPHDGVLRCYDAATGAEVYQQLLPGARDFKSSPWAVGGKVVNVDEDGRTFVVRAGRGFQLLGSNTVGEMCWSSPAPARGALYLRGVEHLFCVRP
jgi:hypothetical protein